MCLTSRNFCHEKVSVRIGMADITSNPHPVNLRRDDGFLTLCAAPAGARNVRFKAASREAGARDASKPLRMAPRSVAPCATSRGDVSGANLSLLGYVSLTRPTPYVYRSSLDLQPPTLRMTAGRVADSARQMLARHQRRSDA